MTEASNSSVCGFDFGEKVKPFKISGIVKNYSWGRPLDEALVAKLARATDRNSRYAELWIGAHPHSSSVCITASKADYRSEPYPHIDLTSRLRDAPEEMLGVACIERFGDQLPFLLKVLSIQQPLSIQLHPDLTLASALNKRDAKNYPDRNHKPEIAIAITPVTLLHNIRDFDDSVRLLKRFPSVLQRLVTDCDGDPRLALIKAVFELTPEENHELIEEAKKVIRGLVEPEEEDLWFLKAERTYPRDRGLWFFFILRLLQLKPGEAIFTGAGCLHAYLYGELIECMASSDNTIRAGLTEKFVDVESLLKALRLPDTQMEGLEQIDLGGMIRPENVDLIKPQIGEQRRSTALSYQPPVKDFAVTLCEDAGHKDGVELALGALGTDHSDSPILDKTQQTPESTLFGLPRVQGPILLLNLRGEVWIDKGEVSEIRLAVGESAFIPAVCVESGHVKVAVKSGKVVIAQGNW